MFSWNVILGSYCVLTYRSQTHKQTTEKCPYSPKVRPFFLSGSSRWQSSCRPTPAPTGICHIQNTKVPLRTETFAPCMLAFHYPALMCQHIRHGRVNMWQRSNMSPSAWLLSTNSDAMWPHHASDKTLEIFIYSLTLFNTLKEMSKT